MKAALHRSAYHSLATHARGATDASRSYIRSLKRSIEYLEAQKAKRQRKDGPESLSSDSAQAQLQGQPAGRRMSSTANISLKDALADFGHFGLNSSPAQQPGTSSHDQQAFSIWSLIKKVMRSPEQNLATGVLDLRGDILAHIDVGGTFNRYLDEVLPRHPFMSRASLTKQYEHVLGSEAFDASVASLDTGRKHTVFITCLVLSTSCPRQGRSMRSNLAGSDLSTCAADMLSQLAESDTIHAMQALIALVIFAYYRLDLQSMTYLLAIAMSRAISAGYHQLSLKSNPSAPDRLDQAQLVATLYMLDRTVSSVMDRPPAIDDKDISEQIFESMRTMSMQPADSLMEDIRLLASLRRKRSQPQIFFTSIYRAWLGTYTEKAAFIPTNARSDLLRLKCRLLVTLIHLPKHPPMDESRPLALESAELHDAMQTCLKWLQHLEVVFDMDDHIFDVLLPFEITSVALLCGSIYSDLRKRGDMNAMRTMKDIHVLSISLPSFLTSVLLEATSMRRVLSKLAFVDLQPPCLDALQDYESLPRKLQDMLGSYIAMAKA
ncbi:hypothetical protein HII31_07497 [Pseudocercospora fuligena]|uniref:Xylanolytic transcriptional activator regulatory domain-containing protein n=1 Tax=Pseudocercospora fuligena TaxID=685502 RepID=A0A8H6RIC6_9PEZI|nr:hypothetical protein HII31_07497 [Pseudocercospora fuligena]